MFLKSLSNISSPSGYESDIKNLIKTEIKEFVDEIFVDKIGNLIVHKKGEGKKILLSAHMDEVGFIITGYNEDGTLKFDTLGNVQKNSIPSKVIRIGKNRTIGVIGIKPIHLQGKSERNKEIQLKDCCIDIGCDCRQQSEKVVEIGEFAVFDTKFDKFGSNLIKGKSLSSALSCGVLVDILKKHFNNDLYVSFNVQKESGNRGAYVVTSTIDPEIVINIDGIECRDSINLDIGKGPVICIKNKVSMFDRSLYENIINIAKEKNIFFQTGKSDFSKNEANVIQMSRQGVRVANICVPCMYMYSNINLASIEDYKNTVQLVEQFINKI